MKNLITFVALLFVLTGFAQDNLAKVLKKYNNNKIPYISASDIDPVNTDAIFLDAREKKEYNTSHIQNAKNLGYTHFDLKKVETEIPDKTSQIIVYCTIGVRSEAIATKLKQAGYTNVYNLFGGIIEWKNTAHRVYNNQNKTTDTIHTYSKEWGKWLNNGVQVYE